LLDQLSFVLEPPDDRLVGLLAKNTLVLGHRAREAAFGIQRVDEFDALAEAERPVIIAGSGCWWADAGAELTAFVESAGVPLYTITMARGRSFRGLASQAHSKRSAMGAKPLAKALASHGSPAAGRKTVRMKKRSVSASPN
jgi:acetolactate synthase-1/2/3 large subunit